MFDLLKPFEGLELSSSDLLLGSNTSLLVLLFAAMFLLKYVQIEYQAQRKNNNLLLHMDEAVTISTPAFPWL